MKNRLLVVATLALLVAGCGRGDRNKGMPSEQQKADLDNAAAMVEGNETIDTSPDSLTLNESMTDPGLNAATPPAGNVAAPAPAAPANAAAPQNGSAAR
jgi:hypothetical protein